MVKPVNILSFVAACLLLACFPYGGAAQGGMPGRPAGPPPPTPQQAMFVAYPPPGPAPSMPPGVPALGGPPAAPMPNPWGPGPHHAPSQQMVPISPMASSPPAPLPTGPSSAAMGGGMAGMYPAPVGSGLWDGAAGADSSPVKARGAGAGGGGSSASSRRHAIEKYSSRIRTISDCSTNHWLEWLEHAEPVYCNRQYLKNFARDLLMSYLFVGFGLRPADPLPAREKNGPSGLLVLLNNESTS